MVPSGVSFPSTFRINLLTEMTSASQVMLLYMSSLLKSLGTYLMTPVISVRCAGTNAFNLCLPRKCVMVRKLLAGAGFLNVMPTLYAFTLWTPAIPFTFSVNNFVSAIGFLLPIFSFSCDST
ncbi:unnamed protein product [Parnassius mnemosyne]|uniref:Uncharacterized protein n=1 Tax=Parnassius mnemosyne TaxID=213953 RepID=A0AAV1KFR0_9NEOP